MAVNETHVDAPPERCFEVLADPRSYAYWVVGSREIRAADPDWPALGSRFHHTLELGVEDHTVVEDVEPNRRLKLRARARPFGTALVTVEMQPEDHGSHLRLEEEPADAITRLLHNPVADRLLHVRNIGSVTRLKELAEGTVPMPSGELPATPEEAAPESERGSGGRSRAAAGFGQGFLAGIAGGLAMSASTVAEMRLTGREPSDVPARAVKRLLGIRRLGPTGARRVTTASHFVVSGLTGGLWGAFANRLDGPARTGALYTIATAPDTAIVPAMGLAPPPWRWTPADMARTVVHHAVFTAVASLAFSKLRG